MKDIFIIEKSFLLRSALHKLIIESNGHSRIHEMISMQEFMSYKGNRDYSLLIVNECLLTERHQSELYRLKLKNAGILKICCKKDTDFNTDEVINIDEEPLSILKKLNKLLVTQKETGKKGNGSKILSTRETDVLKYVALGLTNKEIADKLFLSAHTVITHRKNISSKLGIKTIAGFTVFALLNKIVLPTELGSN